ncbi:hypothetical protein HKD37_02G005389 [Glycine soja]
MNHFFRKVPGRGFPEVFRKKCSSGSLPEEVFFRKTFGYFRKNTSSGNFPEKVLPELPEEPLTGLPEDFSVSLFRHFFRRTLVFSPLVFYPKLRVRGRGTNLFAEKKKKALARLAEKKLHGEEKKKQVPGEEEAVLGEKKLCSGREEESVFRERRRISILLGAPSNSLTTGLQPNAHVLSLVVLDMHDVFISGLV